MGDLKIGPREISNHLDPPRPLFLFFSIFLKNFFFDFLLFLPLSIGLREAPFLFWVVLTDFLWRINTSPFILWLGSFPWLSVFFPPAIRSYPNAGDLFPSRLIRLFSSLRINWALVFVNLFLSPGHKTHSLGSLAVLSLPWCCCPLSVQIIVTFSPCFVMVLFEFPLVAKTLRSSPLFPFRMLPLSPPWTKTRFFFWFFFTFFFFLSLRIFLSGPIRHCQFFPPVVVPIVFLPRFFISYPSLLFPPRVLVVAPFFSLAFRISSSFA